jgi:putative peptide zinc metalloprotease protein
MLCRHCHRWLARQAAVCDACGTPRRSTASPPLELVLREGTHVPLVGDLTIGRAPGNALQLTDPSVSRRHARVVVRGGQPALEDAGSSGGTWLDGRRVDGPRPLHEGDRIALGEERLVVDRRRRDTEAARTIVVPAGDSLTVPAQGVVSEVSPAAVAGVAGELPRLRSGYALKRLAAPEGPRRWVLENLRDGTFMRFDDDDASLLKLLDGSQSVPDLVRRAEERLGPAGPVRLAALLAELGDGGLLAGAARAEDPPRTRADGLLRVMRPRQWSWRGAGALFDRLYADGGWLLFTGPARAAIGALAVIGLGAFALLVIGRYGTPFVVSSRVGIGGIVFVLGRFAVALLHESAHALTLASFGRRVRGAGLKMIAIFPYVFVDTSAQWFEPRRRRLAVTAAGPVSDLASSAVFSLCCLALPAGSLRDVFFQLAFAAYIGAITNLNPFVDRDGYNLLVDVLHEPGLRTRAREQLALRLRGRPTAADSPLLLRYGLFGVGWSLVTFALAVALSFRYLPRLEEIAPNGAAWAALVALWVACLTPLLVVLGPPVAARARESRSGRSTA